MKKTVVELTMMAGNRHQEVDFIGEIVSKILYTLLVMTVGTRFPGVNFVFKKRVFVGKIV